VAAPNPGWIGRGERKTRQQGVGVGMNDETHVWINEGNAYQQLAATQVALMATLNLLGRVLYESARNNGALPAGIAWSFMEQTYEIFDKLNLEIKAPAE
jgi:hypothetical protein